MEAISFHVQGAAVRLVLTTNDSDILSVRENFGSRPLNTYPLG